MRLAEYDISIIVPAYNRGGVIAYTLESIRRSSGSLRVETIIVDDGSEPPAAESIEKLGYAVRKIIRQKNQGLLVARLVGLEHATGKRVLFLDSDDLISPEKLTLHIAAMDAAQADVSYSDTAQCAIEGDYDNLTIVPDAPFRETSDPAEFFISIQPAPHGPVFETAYLKEVVRNAFIPVSPLYNPAAEIWFYFNASIRPARVVKVPGPHAIVGRHAGPRLTNHWEKLGVASLAVLEAFIRGCPKTPETMQARRYVAEAAFQSWRRLPWGFSREFCSRELDVWRKLSDGRDADRLGGRQFRILASFLGCENAARLLKYVQRPGYSSIRTMPDDEMARLLSTLPPA